MTYSLNTVTGIASVPFLAIRSLQELFQEFETTHPQAIIIINRDFYVDDMIIRDSSRQGILKIKSQVANILKISVDKISIEYLTRSRLLGAL